MAKLDFSFMNPQTINMIFKITQQNMISKIPSVYSIKDFGYSVREIKISHKDGLMVSFCGFKSYWVCVKHWKKNEKEKT